MGPTLSFPPSPKKTPENISTEDITIRSICQEASHPEILQGKQFEKKSSRKKMLPLCILPKKPPPIKRRSSGLNVKTNQACSASSGLECRASPSSPRLALPCLAQPCFALPSLASPCPARPGTEPVLIQTGLPRLAEGCNVDPTGSDLPRPRPA